MSKGFVKTAILGFVIRIASRRTDFPYVGYYAKDGSITLDYKLAQTYSTQAQATPHVATVKAMLTGEVQAACAVEVTNKIIVIN